MSMAHAHATAVSACPSLCYVFSFAFIGVPSKNQPAPVIYAQENQYPYEVWRNPRMSAHAPAASAFLQPPQTVGPAGSYAVMAPVQLAQPEIVERVPGYNYGVCVPGDNSSSYPVLQQPPTVGPAGPDAVMASVQAQGALAAAQPEDVAPTGPSDDLFEHKTCLMRDEILRLYSENWEEAKSVTNYPYPLAQLTDDAIHRTFEDINNRFHKTVDAEAFRNAPSKIQAYKVQDECIATKCKFVSPSSPFIDFSPRWNFTIICDPTGNRSAQDMRNSVIQALPYFPIYTDDPSQGIVTAGDPHLGELTVFFKNDEKAFRRAKTMEELAKKITEVEKIQIQSFMTIVTLVRLSVGLNRTAKVRGFSLFAFAYCFVKNYDPGLDKMIRIMDNNSFMFSFTEDDEGNVECSAT
eukprot:GHVS01068786.1.p1 GENE.GHVS01068786.1~~GHVS01068786.1.p1  ORF type:complete len:408 (-),score=32.43 GHVS01068786.1:38-1261(-)